MILGLAAYRITRLLIRDTILDPVRDWLLARWPGEFTVFDRSEVTTTDRPVVRVSGVPVVFVGGGGHGEGTYAAERPTWFGRLIECPWCLGTWVSLVGVVSFYLWGDDLWWWIGGTWMAVSALVGLIASRLDS